MDGCFSAIQMTWTYQFLFKWKSWDQCQMGLWWLIFKCTSEVLSQFLKNTPSLYKVFFIFTVVLQHQHTVQFQWWCGHSGVMFHCRILLSAAERRSLQRRRGSSLKELWTEGLRQPCKPTQNLSGFLHHSVILHCISESCRNYWNGRSEIFCNFWLENLTWDNLN